jgi:MFS family permease
MTNTKTKITDKQIFKYKSVHDISMDIKQNPLEALDNNVVRSVLTGTILITFFVAFLDGYDLVNIGTYLGTLTSLFHANAFEEGLISSILIFGALIGSVFFGFFAVRIGPKFLIILDFVLYGVGAVFSALSVNLAMLYVTRFIIGLGFGGDFAIAPALIADIVPKGKRGRYQTLMFLGYPAGALIAILVTYIFYIGGVSESVAWRPVLGLAVIPTILVVILRSRLTQSPRWLLYRGKLEEFKKSVSRISGISEEHLSNESIHKKFGFFDSLKRGGKNFVALLAGFTVLALGFPVIYIPTALGYVGIKAFTEILNFDLLEWIIAILGVLYGYFTVDKLGRKFNIALAIFILALSNLVLAFIFVPKYGDLIVGFIGLSLFGVYMIDSQLLVLQGESFSPDFKTAFGGITFGYNRAIFFVDSTLVSIVFAEKILGKFLIYEAVIQLAALVIFLIFARETKLKSIEEIVGTQGEVDISD